MKLSENDIIELLTENGGKFRVNNLDHAYNFCKKVALGHYENFPVASVAIPSSIRKHFYYIYSYCRIADDLGDVVGAKNKQLGLNLLDYLAECANNKFKCDNLNPLFLALSNTVDELKLPAEPFVKLTVAFKKDTLSNLQVRLPAIVIGGGLTGIDTATELFAYYPVQVEKMLKKYEQVAAE